ncbi:MAG: recombinase RecT [Patescibacteria group bacterium]
MYETEEELKQLTIKIEDYLFGMGLNLNDQQFQRVFNFCRANKLCPLKEEVQVICYKNVFAIKIAYEVKIRRAEDSKLLNGWKIETINTKDGLPERAICTIWRKDWEHPFIHEVLFSEYKKSSESTNNIWSMKPFTMIKKVAIDQAFSLAFPKHNSGFTADDFLDEKEIKSEKEIKKNKDKITEKQQKELVNYAKTFNVSVQEVKNIFTNYGISNSSDLTTDQYEKVMLDIENLYHNKRSENGNLD